MPLVERLRKRAKELDAKVKLSLTSPPYDFQSGDDRDLLLEAANIVLLWQMDADDRRAASELGRRLRG